MAVGDPLNWAVPKSSWERVESRIQGRYGRTRGYAGFELTRIADHWLLVEEIDDDVLNLPQSDSPHTQKTNDSRTRLEDEEKVTVSHRVHPDTKEQLSIAADQFDVNQGVLLGYVIREYYETDGWDYSLETLEEISNGARPEPEPERREPTSRREKLDVICEQLAGSDDLLESEIADVITEIAGQSVVHGTHGYFDDVLDRLGYVHHPNADGIFIRESRLAERFDLSPADPAYDRKPYEALTKSERVEGLKLALQRAGYGMTVSTIHTDVFNGKGSKSYMRNLADEVADADGFEFRKTPGGKRILKWFGPSPEQSDTHSASESDEVDSNDEQDTRDKIQEEAEENMTALMHAQAATDGGSDQ